MISRAASVSCTPCQVDCLGAPLSRLSTDRLLPPPARKVYTLEHVRLKLRQCTFTASCLVIRKTRSELVSLVNELGLTKSIDQADTCGTGDFVSAAGLVHVAHTWAGVSSRLEAAACTKQAKLC